MAYTTRDIWGKKYSWNEGQIGFRFGVYQDLKTGELKTGFQTCAYLAEFPETSTEVRDLRYTDNQLFSWTDNNQSQVKMVYGFRITKINPSAMS